MSDLCPLKCSVQSATVVISIVRETSLAVEQYYLYGFLLL
jgi:hypothetical protein